MLAVEGLRAYYGRIEVLHGVDLAVAEGEIVALIGANGAGKTTLLRVLSGVHPRRAGRIVFDGREIGRSPSHARVAMGIVQVPEGRQVFAPLTVEDNLALGAFRRRADPRQDMARVFALFPPLAEKRRAPAGSLSGGQQQMLALGRAMMAAPRLLLLDEPSMGLAPTLVAEIFAAVRRLAREGVTILLVEQNARAALALADKAYVLETGRIALAGTGRELLGNDRVRAAYLGM